MNNAISTPAKKPINCEETLANNLLSELLPLTYEERLHRFADLLDMTGYIRLHFPKEINDGRLIWYAPPESLVGKALRGKQVGFHFSEEAIRLIARHYAGFLRLYYLPDIYSEDANSRSEGMKAYVAEVLKATAAKVSQSYAGIPDLAYENYETAVADAIVNPELYNRPKPCYHREGWELDRQWLCSFLQGKFTKKIERRRLDAAMMCLYWARETLARKVERETFPYSFDRVRIFTGMSASQVRTYFNELKDVLFTVTDKQIQGSKPAEIRIVEEFRQHVKAHPNRAVFTYDRSQWYEDGRNGIIIPYPPMLPSISMQEVLRAFPIGERVFEQRATLRRGVLDAVEMRGVKVNVWNDSNRKLWPDEWSQGTKYLAQLRRAGCKKDVPLDNITFKQLTGTSIFFARERLKEQLREMNPSFTEDDHLPLGWLANNWPRIKMQLDWAKAVSITELEIYPKKVDAHGYVRTEYRETSPSCNRIIAKSGDKVVNLQNYPKAMLKALIAKPEGYVRGDLDFRQQEPRIIASLSGDEALIQICKEKDIYGQLTLMFLDPKGDLAFDKKHPSYPKLRTAMKAFVNAFNYGSSETELHRKLQEMNVEIGGKPITEGQVRGIYRSMREMFPKATTMLLEFRKQGTQNIDSSITDSHVSHPSVLGFARTTRHIGTKARRGNIAQNAPIQGTAADMFAETLINLHRICRERGIDWQMIVPMHDGFPFIVREGQENQFIRSVYKAVNQAKQTLLIDNGYADVWFPIKWEGWDKSFNPFLISKVEVEQREHLKLAA